MKKCLILIVLALSLVLLGCKKVIIYNVTIHIGVANPGFKIKNISVKEGERFYYTPQEFSGYIFEDLFLDEDYLHVFKSGDFLNSDLELYAKYNEIANEIILHEFNGSIVVFHYSISNKVIPTPGCPENYKFVEWFQDPDYSVVVNQFNTNYFEIKDLYAKFILEYVEVEFVYISYDFNSGSNLEELDEIVFTYKAKLAPELIEIITDPVKYYEISLLSDDTHIEFPTDFLGNDIYVFDCFVYDEERNAGIITFKTNN